MPNNRKLRSGVLPGKIRERSEIRSRVTAWATTTCDSLGCLLTPARPVLRRIISFLTMIVPALVGLPGLANELEAQRARIFHRISNFDIGRATHADMPLGRSNSMMT